MTPIQRILYLILVICVGGCQSGNISLDEAKKIATELRGGDFRAPERSIAGLREYLGPAKAEPNGDCAHMPLYLDDDWRDKYLASRPPWPGTGNAIVYLQGIARKEFIVGRFLNSIRFLEMAISRFPADTWTGPAKRMSMMVRYYTEIGDFESAESTFSRMSSLFARSKWQDDWRTYGENFGNAAIQQARGNLRDAEIFYRKSLAAIQRLNDSFKVELVTADLSDNLLRQGRLIEAEAMARQLLRKKIFNRDAFSARYMTQLSRILYEQGRYLDAKYLAHWAIDYLTTSCALPSSVGLTSARHSKARALIGLGNWHEAVREFDKLRQSMVAEPEMFRLQYGSDPDWAVALLKSGRPVEAGKMLAEAYKNSSSRLGADHHRSGELLGLMAVSQADNELIAEAMKNFPKALSILLGNGSGKADKSDTAVAKDARIKAIVDRYLVLLSSKEGREFASRTGIDPIAETFRVASAVQGRSVQRALASSAVRSKIEDPELAKLVRTEQDMGHQMLALAGTLSNALSQSSIDNKIVKLLDQKITDLKNARASFIARIEEVYPEYAALTNPKPVTISTVRQHLNPVSAMVATYVTDNRTYVWAFRNSGDVGFAIVEQSKMQLLSDISLLRRALDPGPIATLGDIPDFDVGLAHKLYREILEPVSASWRSAKDIIVVADGPLGQLPFSLLPVAAYSLGADDSLLFDRYRNVQWLAKTHAISNLPNVGALESFSSNQVDVKSRLPFVGFGDPYFNHAQLLEAKKDTQVQFASTNNVRGMPVKLRNRPMTRSADSADLSMLPRLPATKFELFSIANNLGADPSDSVFLGKRAHEEQVKSMRLDVVKVLAFATHGLVPGDLDGLYQPALAMTSPKIAGIEGDGLLTMGEILPLKLSADWVVLSACNTASAEGAGADAVSGLGKAFFYAGARALLVSNWPVHSGATAHLTSTLFNLQATDAALSRTKALQKTRLLMIDLGTQKDRNGKSIFSYAHPLFWAPFIIVGDGGGKSI
jgi:CHAT domain-containing protein